MKYYEFLGVHVFSFGCDFYYYYEFLGVHVFSFGCDFYYYYEFLGVPVFSFGCDFYDILYTMPSSSANSNLS